VAAAFEKSGGKFIVTKDVGVFLCRAGLIAISGKPFKPESG
jgi:hypothetical protein